MSINLDTKTIYEIFRACRFCGAGGGYKMPIIPSAIGIDCAEIELQQKIQECLQIEVHQDDKMPPLICELCVDKVNDFYEFLEMCRQTNQRTRQRLGLPMPKSATSEDDCILGVTEPIYTQTSDEENVAQRIIRPVKVRDDKKTNRSDKKKNSMKKELENLLSLKEVTCTKQPRASTRDSRDSSTSSSSKRSSRANEHDASLSRLKEVREQKKNEPLKPGLKREYDIKYSTVDTTDDEDTGPRRKKAKTEKSSDAVKGVMLRPEAKAQVLSKSEAKSQKLKPEKENKKEKKPPIEEKRNRLKVNYQELPPTSAAPRSRPGPKSAQKALSPPPHPSKSLQSATKVNYKPGPASRKGVAGGGAGLTCVVCGMQCSAMQGLMSHQRAHTVRPTQHALACNPCGEWFLSPEEVAAHHKWHKHARVMYSCRACNTHFRRLDDYTQHVVSAGAGHVPWTEAPAVRCGACWQDFPTRPLLKQHKCAGVDARPPGKCSKCNKYYHTYKNLKKHEAACVDKKKEPSVSEPRIAPSVRRRLKPMRVRLARCDPLLPRAPPAPAAQRLSHARCNVAALPPDYGFDSRTVYPYRRPVRVKREPLEVDGMVSIQKAIRDEVYKEEEYVHWDSDNSCDSDTEFSLLTPHERKRKVPSLTALSLKTVYSKQCLGKVPRKLRKVNHNKFDSLFNTETEFDDVRSGIDSIIDNLSADDNVSFAKAVENNKIVSSDTETDRFILGLTNYDGESINDNPSEADKRQENYSDASKATDDEVIDKDERNSVVNYDDGNATDASINETEQPHSDVPKDIIDDDNQTETHNDVHKENIDDDNMRNNVNETLTFSDVPKDTIDDDNITDINQTQTHNDVPKENIDDDNMRDDVNETLAYSDVPKENIDDDNIGDDINETETHSDVSKENIDDNVKDDTIASLLESQNETLATEDKGPASANNLNIDNNITDKVNSDCDTDKVNGTNDLISEINELYDRKLMEELDAEITL